MSATKFTTNGYYLDGLGTVGSAGLTIYLRYHVTTYANWGEIVSLDEGLDDAAVEYSGDGFAYWANSQGGSGLIGVDPDDAFSDDWWDIAIVVQSTGTSSASATVYAKRADQSSWATVKTYTASTSAIVAVGSWPTYGATNDHETVGLKIWNKAKTTTDLLDEATQATPFDTSGLRFWNSLFDASTAHVNQAGGSDATANGAATTVSVDSGLPLLAGGGGGGGSSDVPGSSQRDRDLRHNGIFRMRGHDVIAPRHRGLFVPERQIHVVPALPDRALRRTPCR